MRNKIVWLLAVLLSLPLATMPSGAQAISTFDDVVSMSDSLEIRCYSSATRTWSDPIDVSATWVAILKGQTYDMPTYTGNVYAYQDGIDALDDRLDEGFGWSVSQLTSGGIAHSVRVAVNGISNQSAVFENVNSVNRLRTSGVSGSFLISCHNGSNTMRYELDGAYASDVRVTIASESPVDGDSIEPYLVNMDIDYPFGYEGVEIPSTRPAKYVAMGDSFSSGEGNIPFEYGTDEDGSNECHRSASAYPNWLSQTPSLNLGLMAFVACSGATTATVLNGGASVVGAWNEPPQVDALSDSTEVVTITIGGNDIGLSDFATACAAPSSECDSSTMIYSTTMNKIHIVLPGSLEDVLTEIADQTLDAKVYVIGYPYVTPSSGLDSLPIQCSYLSSSAGDGADSVGARDVVTALNSEIEDAVTRFTNTLSDTEFTYIDPNTSVDGSFDGHDLCQGLDSYFHNVAPNDVFGNGYRQRIFHPNIDGQYEYYQIVSGVIALN